MTHFKGTKISELGVPIPVSYKERMISKASPKTSHQSTKKVQKEQLEKQTIQHTNYKLRNFEEIFNMIQDERLTPEQIKLRDAVNQEAERLYTSEMSDKEVGPAVAGVFDMKTGKYYFGKNDAKGRIPSVLHPLIRERIKNMPKEIMDSYAHMTLGAGSHAEVIALNEALLANPTGELKDFMVYVVRSGRKLRPKGLPMPRCPHCEFITKGANYFPEGLYYGKS